MTHDAAKLGLYQAHRINLINYAQSVVGERMMAEDIVQDAFLRFVALNEKPIEQPLAYLYRIVRNLALDVTRRHAAERRQQETPPEWMQPGATHSPEQHLLQTDQMRQVAAALAELPEQAQRAVKMHRIGGYTLQQIAEHLNVSLTTAHRLVRDSVVHLAARLAADEPGRTPENKDRTPCNG